MVQQEPAFPVGGAQIGFGCAEDPAGVSFHWDDQESLKQISLALSERDCLSLPSPVLPMDFPWKPTLPIH